MKSFLGPAALLLWPCLSAPTLTPAVLKVALKVVPPDTARYDFGTRGCGDPSPLTHTFRLRNTGTQPVTVTSVPTSCHCTQAAPEGGAALPVTLKPGATLPLTVTVQPDRLGPGPVSKTVWVYVRGTSRPALTLEIVGTLYASH